MVDVIDHLQRGQLIQAYGKGGGQHGSRQGVFQVFVQVLAAKDIERTRALARRAKKGQALRGQYVLILK